MKKSIVAQTLALALSFSVVGTSSSLAEAAQALQENSTPELLRQLDLPVSLGTVTEHHLPADKPVILLIQDLHLHYPTQKRITQILNRVYDKGLASGPVAVEGLNGPYDTSALALLPTGNSKDELVDYFMSKGELSGDEAFAVLRGESHRLIGIDDAKLYQVNRDLFRRTFSTRKMLDRRLGRLRNEFEYLKHRHYTRALRKWDIQAYEDLATAKNRLEHRLAIAKSLEKKIPLLPNLVQADFDLSYLQRLVRQETTAEETGYIAQRLPSFVALTESLLSLKEDESLTAASLEETLKSSIDFYAVALMRDDPMAKNAVRLLGTLPKRSHLPLVVGGFHTKGLTQAFREAGVGYVVIAPWIDEIATDYHDLYERRLNGQSLTVAEMKNDFQKGLSLSAELKSRSAVSAVRVLSPVLIAGTPAAAAAKEFFFGARTQGGGRLRTRDFFSEVKSVTPVFSPTPRQIESGRGDSNQHVPLALGQALSRLHYDNSQSLSFGLLSSIDPHRNRARRVNRLFSSEILLDQSEMLLLARHALYGSEEQQRAAQWLIDFRLRHELYHSRALTKQPFIFLTLFTLVAAALFTLFYQDAPHWIWSFPGILSLLSVRLYHFDWKDEEMLVGVDLRASREMVQNQELSSGIDQLLREHRSDLASLRDYLITLKVISTKPQEEKTGLDRLVRRSLAAPSFFSFWGARPQPQRRVSRRTRVVAEDIFKPDFAAASEHSIVKDAIMASVARYQDQGSLNLRGLRRIRFDLIRAEGPRSIRARRINTLFFTRIQLDINEWRILAESALRGDASDKVMAHDLMDLRLHHELRHSAGLTAHPLGWALLANLIAVVWNAGESVHWMNYSLAGLLILFGIKFFLDWEDERKQVSRDVEILTAWRYDEGLDMPADRNYRDDVENFLERLMSRKLPDVRTMDELQAASDAWDNNPLRALYWDLGTLTHLMRNRNRKNYSQILRKTVWTAFWNNFLRDFSFWGARTTPTAEIGLVDSPDLVRKVEKISRVAGGIVAGADLADSYGRVFRPDGRFFTPDGNYTKDLQKFMDSLSGKSVQDMIKAGIMYYDIRSGFWRENPEFSVAFALAFSKKIQEKTGKKNGVIIHLAVDAYQHHFDAAQVFADAILRTGITDNGGGIYYWGVRNGGSIRNYAQLFEATHGVGGDWVFFTQSHRTENDISGAKLGIDGEVFCGPQIRHVGSVTTGTLFDGIIDVRNGHLPVVHSSPAGTVINVVDTSKNDLKVAADLIRATSAIGKDSIPDNQLLAGAKLFIPVAGRSISMDVVRMLRGLGADVAVDSEEVDPHVSPKHVLDPNEHHHEEVLEINRRVDSFAATGERRLGTFVDPDGDRAGFSSKMEDAPAVTMPGAELVQLVIAGLAGTGRKVTAISDMRTGVGAKDLESALVADGKEVRVLPFEAGYSFFMKGMAEVPADVAIENTLHFFMNPMTNPLWGAPKLLQRQSGKGYQGGDDAGLAVVYVVGAMMHQWEGRNPLEQLRWLQQYHKLKPTVTGEKKPALNRENDIEKYAIAERMKVLARNWFGNHSQFQINFNNPDIEVVSGVHIVNNKTGAMVLTRYSNSGPGFTISGEAYKGPEGYESDQLNEMLGLGYLLMETAIEQLRVEGHQFAFDWKDAAPLKGAFDPMKYGIQTNQRPAEPTGRTIATEKAEAKEISAKLRTPILSTGNDDQDKKFELGGYDQPGYGVPVGAAIEGSFATEGNKGYFAEGGKEAFLRGVRSLTDFFERHRASGNPIRYIIKIGIGGQHTPLEGIAQGFSVIDSKTGKIVGEYELGKDYEKSLNAALKNLGVSWKEVAIIPSSKSGATDETMVIFSQLLAVRLKQVFLSQGISAKKADKIVEEVFEYIYSLNIPEGKERPGKELFQRFSFDEMSSHLLQKVKAPVEVSLLQAVFGDVLGRMYFETTDKPGESRLSAFIRNSGLDHLLGENKPGFGAMFENVGGRWTADLHMMVFLAFHHLDAEAYWETRFSEIKKAQVQSQAGNALADRILDDGITDVALVVPDELFWFGKSIEQNFNESIWQEGFSTVIAIPQSLWRYQKQHYEGKSKRLIFNMTSLGLEGPNVVDLSSYWDRTVTDKNGIAKQYALMYSTFYTMTSAVGARLIARALRKEGFSAADVNLSNLSDRATQIVQSLLFTRQPYVELGKKMVDGRFQAIQILEAKLPGAIALAKEEAIAQAERRDLMTNLSPEEIAAPSKISSIDEMASLIQQAILYAEQTGRKFVPLIYVEGEKFQELRIALTKLGIEWVLQGTGDQHINLQQVIAQPQRYLPFVISFVPPARLWQKGLRAIGFAKSHLDRISPHLLRDYFAEATYKVLVDPKRAGGKALFVRLLDNGHDRGLLKEAFDQAKSKDTAYTIHPGAEDLKVSGFAWAASLFMIMFPASLFAQDVPSVQNLAQSPYLPVALLVAVGVAGGALLAGLLKMLRAYLGRMKERAALKVDAKELGNHLASATVHPLSYVAPSQTPSRGFVQSVREWITPGEQDRVTSLYVAARAKLFSAA